MKSARVGIIALLTTALGSCSYGIDLRAVSVNGRLAFVSTDTDFECIANIYVVAEGDTVAKAEKGDQVGLVVNGQAFWWTKAPVTECKTSFPVFYGQLYSKTPDAVRPKRLRFNVIYQVQTQGQGAYGSGRFRVLRGGRIENLPPAPPPSTPNDALEPVALNSS